MSIRTTYLICDKSSLKDCGARPLDVHKSCKKWFLLTSYRHIIACLHIDEQFGVDAQSRLYHQRKSVVTGRLPFSISFNCV